ncbi:MAG: hypothetical protein R3315_02585 [Woeseiaceae bacterium]|nr:hypothetical protein [Woeseiaceae bacterium]
MADDAPQSGEERRWRRVYAAVVAVAIATMLALDFFSRHFSG